MIILIHDYVVALTGLGSQYEAIYKILQNSMKRGVIARIEIYLPLGLIGMFEFLRPAADG